MKTALLLIAFPLLILFAHWSYLGVMVSPVWFLPVAGYGIAYGYIIRSTLKP